VGKETCAYSVGKISERAVGRLGGRVGDKPMKLLWALLRLGVRTAGG
jgi:hypothetical protein